jgi:hypothetical protein
MRQQGMKSPGGNYIVVSQFKSLWSRLMFQLEALFMRTLEALNHER